MNTSWVTTANNNLANVWTQPYYTTGTTTNTTWPTPTQWVGTTQAMSDSLQQWADQLAVLGQQMQHVVQQRPYLGPPREFNRYLNASDMLEEFIAFAGGEGLRADEILRLPVELFVKWLIMRACEADGEPTDVTVDVAAHRPRQPRCLGCQRYMRRGAPVPLHGPPCAQRYFARAALVA